MLVMRLQTDIVPIVMAGIIAIYGLVVAVLIANDLKPKISLFTGFIQLGAGLSVGLSGLAAGYVSLIWIKITLLKPKLEAEVATNDVLL